MNHQVHPAHRFHAAFHPLPVRKACSVPQPSTLNNTPPKGRSGAHPRLPQHAESRQSHLDAVYKGCTKEAQWMLTL
jgi:hypothetical protein